MRTSRVSEEEVLVKIAVAFRRHGYDGASVRLLAKATGLEAASLYTRFPDGKEEMALKVVARACEWLGANVFEVLRGSGTAGEKVGRAARRLREFYQDGTLGCVLDTLTLGESTDAVRAAVRGAYEAWLKEFSQVAREAGATAGEARVRARQAIVEIEGALVLARVTGDGAAFLRAIQRLPELLT
jgi:AcrR family transcriptional regulator